MSLGTLIVQREIASIREVEEALARQVLYGGDFVTNLLEVCRIEEAVLLPVVAEAYGLPPAAPGELPRPEDEAKRLVAAEVAGERNLAPLTVDRYGLTVAVSEPLSRDVEQELSFALALPIAQKLAPLVRIRQALARDYGLPFDRRLQRLLLRMLTEGPRTTSTFPPPREGGRIAAPRPPSVVPPPRPQTPAPLRPSRSPEQGAARTLVRQTDAVPRRPLRRRRGPLTIEVAKAELDEATERDTIFDLLFEFARQYFDYTAVFVVHGEIAEGRDSFGEGAPREKIVRIGVPLDLPSILSLARERRATVQRVPAGDGLDEVLMRDLGRSGRTVCIVLPVVVRTRVVALLFGDGGDGGVDPATLSDVEAIVAQATSAFERIIVRRKLKGTVPPTGYDSLLPRGTTVAPPTMESAPDAPAAYEDLAPPIRDLMNAPPSLAADTARDPVVAIMDAPDASGVLAGDGLRSEQPPPMNVLAVRRPSGAPIPREEPESAKHVAEGTSDASPGARPSVPPSPSKPRSRRAEAPALEFAAAVPPPSSVFGTTTDAFAPDETEQRLLAEIHGRVGPDGAPTTLRDEAPALVDPPSSTSPKAESPTPPEVASEVAPEVASVRPAAVTDVSPVALPVIERAVMPVTDDVVETSPPPPPPPPPSTDEDLARPSAPAVLVSAEDSDVDVVDPDATPIAPPVAFADSDATPAAPPVAYATPSVPVVITSVLRSSPVLPPESRPMPASEQQISVPAHRPPSSHADQSRVLPSVIVDVASEYVGLVDRILAGPDEEAEAELVRAGGYAMPAIMARFPGPVTVEPDRLVDGPLPRAAECGPIIRVVAGQRRTALPFVLAHVEDSELETRFWATYLLTELVYPEVLEPIVTRLFDPEPRVRRAARSAARCFADVHPAPIVERVELIAMDASRSRESRILAVEALGETRDPGAVPALIRLLGDPDGSFVQAVRAALSLVARQDFGTSTEKWSAWWSAHKDHHRIEWLIDALMHDQAQIRAAAGEELKATTKEYFGYYDDLPKRERERAQSRYREWWNAIGRVRFSRAASRG